MTTIDSVFVGLAFWYVAFTLLNAFFPPRPRRRHPRITFRVGRPPRTVGT